MPTTNWPSNAAINQDNTGESVHHNNEANNQRNDEEKVASYKIFIFVPIYNSIICSARWSGKK